MVPVDEHCNAGIACCTNAVLAICVVSVSTAAVGQVGVPVSPGELNVPPVTVGLLSAPLLARASPRFAVSSGPILIQAELAAFRILSRLAVVSAHI